MSINEISREEFDSYNPARMGVGLASERAWYADTSKDIIGSLLKDSIDKDWGYVILALHDDGLYRFADGNVSIQTFDEAESILLNRMREIDETECLSESLFEGEELKEDDKNGKILVADINEELKCYFSRNPLKMYDLSPRKFEELIASIMEDMGFDVELTQATRDGGSDIIAYVKNAVCEYLTLVECKKYAPDNKVGVGIVREVTGVHHIKNATKSIIVTTSFFTPDAIKEAAAFKNNIDLKNYDDVKQWLLQYR